MMNLDCEDLAQADPLLYSQLVKYPAEVIVLLDQEAHTIWAQGAGDALDDGTQLTARHLGILFAWPGAFLSGRERKARLLSGTAVLAAQMCTNTARLACCADQAVQPAGDQGDPRPDARGHQPAGLRQRHGHALQQRHS